MNTEEFRAKVESEKVPMDSYDKMLRIAFIDMDYWLGMNNGMLDIVESLHARGWSSD